MVVRIGYEASGEQCGPGEPPDLAAEAERRGPETVAVPDRLQDVADVHGPGGGRYRSLGRLTTDVLPGLRERAAAAPLAATGSPA